MKLKETDIRSEGERFCEKEEMKHRFKEKFVMYPTSPKDMPFNDSFGECGYTRKSLKSKKNKGGTRKPYWRKKRSRQKKSKALWRAKRVREIEKE